MFKFTRIVRRATEWIGRGKYPVVKKFLDDQGSWTLHAVLFPIPFIFLNSYFNNRKKTIRQHPRTCTACKSAMRLLSEKDEDTYLDKKMQREEELKSVDYDVWLCTSCSAIDILPFLNDKTNYTVCPECKAIAYRIETKTLKQPTVVDVGREQVTKSCLNCGYKKQHTNAIPRLDPPTYSSESSSSSSSSSSWDSGGSSSSSDSGGSWGGGDSGGGGSSSSW